jgi:RTX calcium-binding nonapeptide repeat (4 copies)
MTVLATFDAIDLAEPQLPGSPQSRSKIKDGSFLIDDDNSYKPSPPKSEPPKNTTPSTPSYNSPTYEQPKPKPPKYEQPDLKLPSTPVLAPPPVSLLNLEPGYLLPRPQIISQDSAISFTPSFPGEAFIGTDGDDRVAIERSPSQSPFQLAISGGTIFGLGGNDTIYGEGNDLLDGGAGNDLLIGGSGNSVIFGGDGDDTIYAFGGMNSLYGNQGSDLIYGGVYDDQIQGGKGDDILQGSDGNDSLLGGLGQDFLLGEGDADRFILADEFNPSDVKKSDKIGDFKTTEGDLIFIVSSFGKEAISYKKIENEKSILSQSQSQYWYIGDLFIVMKPSTAIVAPNGNILGVVFGVTDVAAIQSAITVVPTLADAITL